MDLAFDPGSAHVALFLSNVEEKQDQKKNHTCVLLLVYVRTS